MVVVVVLLATLGKSLGLRERYVATLIWIFEVRLFDIYLFSNACLAISKVSFNDTVSGLNFIWGRYYH